MGNYTVDDGEESYTVNLNIPRTKRKILRRHKRVLNDIKRIWKSIRDIMRMYISYGMDTDDLMKNYVKLFINQSRIKG